MWASFNYNEKRDYMSSSCTLVHMVKGRQYSAYAVCQCQQQCHTASEHQVGQGMAHSVLCIAQG